MNISIDSNGDSLSNEDGLSNEDSLSNEDGRNINIIEYNWERILYDSNLYIGPKTPEQPESFDAVILYYFCLRQSEMSYLNLSEIQFNASCKDMLLLLRKSHWRSVDLEELKYGLWDCLDQITYLPTKWHHHIAEIISKLPPAYPPSQPSDYDIIDNEIDEGISLSLIHI